jgi:hypothetical protein
MHLSFIILEVGYILLFILLLGLRFPNWYFDEIYVPAS